MSHERDYHGEDGILGGMVMTGRFEEPVKRRDFLGIAALGALLTAMGAALAGVIRLPRPSLLPEPSKQYKIGDPSAFPLGEARVPEGKGVYILHGENGFCAISSTCTHLGCIVKKTDDGFDCPCHGSRFDRNGKAISGPAPRPLDWFEITVAPDGQLVVDEDRRVRPGTYFEV
jgi:cytochrome b6-f complex iron-sulfur subunit